MDCAQNLIATSTPDVHNAARTLLCIAARYSSTKNRAKPTLRGRLDLQMSLTLHRPARVLNRSARALPCFVRNFCTDVPSPSLAIRQTPSRPGASNPARTFCPRDSSHANYSSQPSLDFMKTQHRTRGGNDSNQQTTRPMKLIRTKNELTKTETVLGRFANRKTTAKQTNRT